MHKMQRGVAVAFISLSLSAGLFAQASDPAAVADQLRLTKLDPARAFTTRNVTLDTGAGSITLIEGTVIPAPAVAGRSFEYVFIGNGSIQFEPPDRIEAGQLELFTGSPKLIETFSEAVLVSARPDLVEKLRGSIANPAGDLARAQTLFDRWRSSSEREIANTEATLFAAALGDPFANRHFGAWIHGKDTGAFVYYIDTFSRETARVAQFIELDATERERRRIRRTLHREQKRGRSLGLSVEDLGDLDFWAEAPVRDATGGHAGAGGFEPEKYALEVVVADKGAKLSGKARLHVRANADGRRVLPLTLHGDAVVDRVTDGQGKTLLFLRSGYDLIVVLAAPARKGETTIVEVSYSGNLIDREGKLYALRDTLHWYPHAGSLDRALYDVKLTWPRDLEIVAVGRRTEGGENAATRWERRVVDVPTLGFTFEIGNLKKETIQAGHVTITVAFDPSQDASRATKSIRADTMRNLAFDADVKGLSPAAREEIKVQLRDSLLFYEQQFGPYPLDYLTVVNVPRTYSQSTLGFITLSTDQMADLGKDLDSVIDMMEEDGGTDRRLIVAHEVAHQWWGHIVGWAEEEDRWMSEALASYSATLYGRKNLDWSNRFKIGLTTRWQSRLSQTTEGGRSVESLAPLVSVSRLATSRYGFAYVPIMYQKGMLVIDMIARAVGEDRFPRVLQAVVATSANQNISTDQFLGKITQTSGTNVRPLANAFIFGTGIPEVLYSYTTAKLPNGKWNLTVRGQHQTPFHFKHRVVKTASGWDVVRETVAVDLQPLAMTVPVQAGVDMTGSGRKKKGSLTWARNLIQLKGAKDFEAQMEVPWEPQEFFIDKDREVFAKFYNEKEDPKGYFLNLGINLAASGKHAEAEEALKRSIAAEPSGRLDFDLGFELGSNLTRVMAGVEKQQLNAWAHFELARLYVDTNRDAEALAMLGKARKSLSLDNRDWIQHDVELLEARLDLRRGNYDAVVNRLRKHLFGDEKIETAQGYALMAAAAKQKGLRKEFEQAIEEARERNVDVAVLK